jgi:LPS export ABC transporter protein LptC
MFDRSILKLLGLLLLLGLWIPGCGAPDPIDPVTEGERPQEPPPQEQEDPQTATTDLTYQDITLTESLPDGRILWRLTATMAQVEAEQTTARLESVTGELFDPEGQSVRIRAQTGQVYPLERRVVLGDQVWVQSSRYGIQMRAKAVEWRADDNLLEAQEQVELAYFDPFPEDTADPADPIPPDQAIWQASGSRLTFDFGTEQLQLWNPDQQPIQALLRDPDLTLTALRLLWDPQSDQLRAEQQVRVEDPARQLILTGTDLTHGITDQTLAVVGEAYVQGQASGQQLWANRLDWIIGDPVIEATGAVRYQQPGQALTVTGSSARFNHIANTVAVTGSTTTTQLTLP